MFFRDQLCIFIFVLVQPLATLQRPIFYRSEFLRYVKGSEKAMCNLLPDEFEDSLIRFASDLTLILMTVFLQGCKFWLPWCKSWADNHGRL